MIRTNQRVGHASIACRWTCTVLVASPLLYRISVADGDVYHFFILVVLAPVAGFVLFANSLFCLFRYRNWKSASLSLAFILVSSIGVITAAYYLPQFRM
jgi:hypothetical protein